jgi:hypothetical protein
MMGIKMVPKTLVSSDQLIWLMATQDFSRSGHCKSFQSYNIRMDLKRNRAEGCGLDSSDSGEGKLGSSCGEHGNAPSRSIKGRAFLD